jgi:N-acetylneuraminic acid mutarotase
MKSFLLLSFYFFFTVQSFSQITIDYSSFDFGVLNGWTPVNGSEANKWHIGGAESYYDPFSRIGFYISSNGGTSYGYENNSSSIVHIYKDILINTVNDDMVLTFKAKCFGEPLKDNLSAYILTDFSTPQAGVELNEQFKVGYDEYSESDYWRGYKFEIKRDDVPGNYLRLAFSWKNDNNGTGRSPAAIDNIRLTEWNISAGIWTTKQSYSQAKYYGGSITSGTSLYTLGGDNTGTGTGTFNLAEYDIPGNTWKEHTSYPTVIRLNEAAKFDGKLFSVGGFIANSTEPTEEVKTYNFGNFSWDNGTAFPKKIFYHRLAVHDWNTLFSVGGSDETDAILNNVYFLEKGSNTWQEATPLPGDGRADGGFAIVNKRAVYIGGFTNSFDFPVQVDSVFVGIIDPTNPANITWESRSNFPGGPRARLRAFEWGTDQVIVVGGATGQGFSPLFNDVWVYDIDQDQWSQLAALPAELCAYYGGTERFASNNWAVVITGGVKTGPLLSASTYVLFDTLQSATSVEAIDNTVPESFLLAQNYPNPFNPSTTIQFSLPEQLFMKLEVFNTLGEKVTTLVSEELNAGNYEYEWNASNLPSGVYLYKMQTTNFSTSKKMILIK